MGCPSRVTVGGDLHGGHPPPPHNVRTVGTSRLEETEENGKKKKKSKTMRPECGLIVDSRILGLNLGSAVQPWASGLTSLGICCTHLFKGRGEDQVS